MTYTLSISGQKKEKERAISQLSQTGNCSSSRPRERFWGSEVWSHSHEAYRADILQVDASLRAFAGNRPPSTALAHFFPFKSLIRDDSSRGWGRVERKRKKRSISGSHRWPWLACRRVDVHATTTATVLLTAPGFEKRVALLGPDHRALRRRVEGKGERKRRGELYSLASECHGRCSLHPSLFLTTVRIQVRRLPSLCRPSLRLASPTQRLRASKPR